MEGVHHGRSLLHAGLGDVYLLLSGLGLGLGWPMSLASPEAGKNENIPRTIPPDVDACDSLFRSGLSGTSFFACFLLRCAKLDQASPGPPHPRTSSLEVVYMRQDHT
jgi:hypothetical protein